MTIAEIIADWLRAHGYDGLTDGDCACELTDLLPCSRGVIPTICRAGHRVKGCTSECGHQCDYHIVAEEI